MTSIDPFAVRPASNMTPYDILIQWNAAKETLDKAKEAERSARDAVVKAFFPNPVKGTNRVPLQNDHNLKYVLGYNYSFKIPGDEKAKPDVVVSAVSHLQVQIHALGEAASLLARRLIKWRAEPSGSEYQKLCSDAAQGDGTAIAVKALFDRLLSMKEDSPKLEIELPK